jgi:hypothetical protein
MKPELAHSIRNDWQYFRLLSLDKVPALASLAAVPGHGPFIISQEGSAPGDLKFRSYEFLLTKQNTWLPLFAFVKLPVDERRALCLYAGIPEIMAQLEELMGPPVLDARHVAEALNISLPDEAEILQALDEARGRAQSIPR